MEPETRRKIEETVIDILKKSDMERMTECKVRIIVSEQLGVDLSDSDHKRFIRGVVESFLLTTVEEIDEGKEAETNTGKETEELVQEEQKAKLKREGNDDGDGIICKLSSKKNVAIHDFKGKRLVSIREYYQKDGKQLPSAKGISLTAEQWSAFKKGIPAIDEAVTKMQSKLRSENDGEQKEDASNSMTACSPLEFVPIEINRFDGKNYHCWAAQMEFFLKQLKVVYVLSNPCPSVSLSHRAGTEEIAQAKAAEKKWVNDDYICRRNILSSLSDHLYHQYSKKTKNAKELWEELKLVYLYEEFGTKRSEVKKYIEFQIVDEKPIVEQVQELNNVADSIIAAGMLIDENFHVSAIISKLPPSWKAFCLKLIREEHMPFWTLMNHIRSEEESRTQDKQGKPSKHVNYHQPHMNLGPRMRDMKRPGMSWKRRETELDGKDPVCFNCGKKGHISRHCPSKRLDKETNVKQDGDSLSTPAGTDVHMVET